MPPSVLCVDDDRHLCQILEKTLAREGYRVLLAHDGDEALALLQANPPQLVLLDVLLPKRDGFAVLEALRGLPGPEASTPVLMMTGCRVTPQYQERATRLGAAGILAKPVPLTTLVEEVGKQVKEEPPAVRAAKRRKRAQPGGTGSPAPRSDSLAGEFDHLGFPRLLHHLHGLRATGVLLLGQGKKRKALQLRDGYPVAIQSNLIHECLGNWLMHRGVIDEETLRESLARRRRGEGLQGQVLVAMEVLDEEEMARALREQAEEKLFEVFGWEQGSYQLQLGGRLKRGNELALDLSPANLILRGVRHRTPLAQIDACLHRRADHVVVAGEPPFYRHQEIELSDEERALVESGPRPLRDWLGEAEPLRRALFALLAAEVLDLRSRGQDPGGAAPRREAPARRSRDPEQERILRAELAARTERMRSLSYFELLEVPEDAGPEALQEAYERLASEVHPDRYSQASDTIRQLAEELHRLVSRAYETLADPRGRAHYLAELRRGERQAAQEQEGRRALDAEIEFQKGETNLKARDYETALRYFGSALSLCPEEGEYHAHYGWCLHLCHPDDASIAGEAIEHVKRAVKLARDREKPYLFLGRLYKAVGKTQAAESMFTRAVQIRADCVEAIRELRLINLRREKSKGLVRRLLRR